VDSRKRDQSVERLLRQSLRTPRRAGATDACLNAETLAAWVDGGLTGAALEDAQSHVADCNRCQSVVGALARMHLAGADFPMCRPNALSVSGWRPLFEQAASRADEVQIGLRDFIASELEFLESGVWPKQLPAGVIHADLFPDNVFFLRDRVSGIIDFTFACNDTLAYDVAICLNAWCFESDYSFNVTKARAFLAAYGRERKLSDAEERVLPLLARGAALRFLLTRLVDFLNVPVGALVRPKDPLEYVRKLRFQQGVSGIRDYGVLA